MIWGTLPSRPDSVTISWLSPLVCERRRPRSVTADERLFRDLRENLDFFEISVLFFRSIGGAVPGLSAEEIDPDILCPESSRMF